MTEYVVKIAFWLRAYDSMTIEASIDAEAMAKAKSAAKAAMDRALERLEADIAGASGAERERK